MHNLRKEFPVLQQYTYLNTPESGLIYDKLINYRHELDLDFLIDGSIFRNDHRELLSGVRRDIGSFLGCNSEQVILAHNFTSGLNTLLNGLDATTKILVLDKDYPSLVFGAISRDYDIYYAQVDTNLEENISKAIAAHEPDIFIFSIVQYLDGTMVDLDFLNQIKEKYPELLLVADGTQFCGTKAFDFDSSGIDIMGCSGYKWLLSGYGNGFFLFKKGVLNQITPQKHKISASGVDYPNEYTNPRSRFESGHLDTLSFASLGFSIRFLSEIGIVSIENHIQKLVSIAKEELINMKLLDSSVNERLQHGAILNIKGDKKMHLYLKEQNIITAIRGNGIRIGFHFFNTEMEINELLGALHRYC